MVQPDVVNPQTGRARASVIWGDGCDVQHACCIVMGINAASTDDFQFVLKLANGFTCRQKLSVIDFAVLFSHFAKRSIGHARKLAEREVARGAEPAPDPRNYPNLRGDMDSRPNLEPHVMVNVEELNDLDREIYQEAYERALAQRAGSDAVYQLAESMARPEINMARAEAARARAEADVVMQAADQAARATVAAEQERRNDELMRQAQTQERQMRKIRIID